MSVLVDDEIDVEDIAKQYTEAFMNLEKQMEKLMSVASSINNTFKEDPKRIEKVEKKSDDDILADFLKYFR